MVGNEVSNSDMKRELDILLGKLKEGDEYAFEEVYKKCYLHIKFLCSKLCDNQEDVEEVVQDTFIAAFKKNDELRADTFLGLLRKIAARGCYAKRRKNQRENAVYLEDVEVEPQELDNDFLPAQYLQNKESHVELLGIINDLSPMQRKMIYLYYYADINTEEIGRLHNCPSANVRQTLHVARNRIKDKLEVQAIEKPSLRIANMASVSLAAVLYMEEELFIMGYESVGAIAALDTAGKAAGMSAVGKACAIAAVCIVSAAVYFSVMPNAPPYEAVEPTAIVTPALESGLDEAEPPPVEVVEEPPEEEPAEELPYTPYEPEPESHVYEETELTTPMEEIVEQEDYSYTIEAVGYPDYEDIQGEQYPLDEAYYEPYEPETEEEADVIEEPEPEIIPEPEPTPEPEPEEPIRTDRTAEILSALGAASNNNEAARIINQYGFTLVDRIIDSMGKTLRFYVLNDGSGDILVGVAANEDGSQWNMRFEHFNNRQRITDIMELFNWMEQ